MTVVVFADCPRAVGEYYSFTQRADFGKHFEQESRNFTVFGDPDQAGHSLCVATWLSGSEAREEFWEVRETPKTVDGFR